MASCVWLGGGGVELLGAWALCSSASVGGSTRLPCSCCSGCWSGPLCFKLQCCAACALRVRFGAPGPLTHPAPGVLCA